MMNPITMTISDIVKNADLSYQTRLHAASVALFWLCDNAPLDAGPQKILPPSLYTWRNGRHVPNPDPRRELVFVLESIAQFPPWVEAIWVTYQCPADMREMIDSAGKLARDLAADLEADKSLDEQET